MADKHRGKRAGGHFVMGRNAVKEALRHLLPRVKRILVSTRAADLATELKEIASKVEISKIDPARLTEILGSESHQGVAAEMAETEPLDVKRFLEESDISEPSLIVALDSVFDPQNLGSIFRAAECFGADALLWSKNRGSGLTPVVSKSSAGASELVPRIVVSNLVDGLRKLKDAGYWIVGAAVGGDSTELSRFEFPARSVLVMGSEGEGLSRLVTDLCDFKVFIPMRGHIDSLNVSQAAAVFLSRYASLHPNT